uniref:Uncharacterized protein n=1 Tax=Minutocellus polymorphus TaxID=265543 RepID=A0A7S0APU7_9STRA|mmetsp:Transcript_1922/g.3210  ORF Transcript_1922/g.3210 Transcript_1922/m.3210 type:complete len:317 (+) Transcript_1922:149-1099(+)|eukprot:CAMPEP_0197719992 /NCGR_PEP_ID=MMETSP1434-20131217/3501_1 /TAXON_ID=265543 /ORGANISM="Minutocellus polymorphus, Strain CCMP3303" /LENGTH=316 /DNA_ID=CAMNT_0043304785 /DNA_START=142 /DNA_END=1092 /DNA_ORIENTATION=-
MTTSTLIPTTFTLEIIPDDSAEPGTLNLPSDPIPAQLIGMDQAGDDWRQIHAETVSVAARTHAHEQNIDILKKKESNKRQEKSWDLFGGSSKKKKDKTKKGGDQLQNIEEQIEKESEAIAKDWDRLAHLVTYIGQKYGMYVEVMHTSKGKKFGLEMTVETGRAGFDAKAMIRYDYRRSGNGAWNLPLEQLFTTFESLNVSEVVWAEVWKEVNETVKDQLSADKEVSLLKKKFRYEELHLAYSNESGDARRIQNYVYKFESSLEGRQKATMESERSWKLLESKVTDLFLPFGLMPSLLVNDLGGAPMYRGLQFRKLS